MNNQGMLLGHELHEVSEYILRILKLYSEMPVSPLSNAFKYILASIQPQSGLFALPVTL